MIERASKVGSVVIALGYAVACVISEGGLTPDIIKLCAMLLLPLGLIWFPEEIGSYRGYVSRGSTIDTETPPFIVSGLGWLFLAGPLVLMLCLG
jgi:hypothetical protein